MCRNPAVDEVAHKLTGGEHHSENSQQHLGIPVVQTVKEVVVIPGPPSVHSGREVQDPLHLGNLDVLQGLREAEPHLKGWVCKGWTATGGIVPSSWVVDNGGAN